MRATVFGATETHTPSGVNVTPDGRPARATWTTSWVVGSTRRSAPPTESATHKTPSPTAIPVGDEPTFSRWLSSLVSGSTRLTVPSPAFVTHTAPSPTARPAGAFPPPTPPPPPAGPGGRFPTRIVSVPEPVSRARRATTPRSGWATQRLPNPI